MLQNIRDRATGPVAWFIVALITVPFALWGINSYFSGGARSDVAKVGDQTITQPQFQNAYEQRFRRLQSVLGKRFDPDRINQARFRRGVLQGLINQALLTQHAMNAGYSIGDSQVLDYLTQVPAFQENGRFSPDTYRSILSRQGMTPEAFEASVRRSLMDDQLQQGIAGTAFVTPALAGRAYALIHESRRFSYALFQPSAYADKVQIGDSDVRAYYDKHKAQYQTPERVRLSYVDLSLAHLEADVQPSEAVLKKLYASEKDQRFSTPAARKARHILITPKNGDAEAAEKKIEQIRQKLENGANFAAVAKQVSDDQGSASNGGELGWITHGMMPGALEQALFSLKPGEISQPVKTSFGWHLIQLEDVRPAQVKAFDSPEVQKALKAQYRQQHAGQQFSAEAGKLDQLTFENPNSLVPAAKALGLDVKTTDWLTRDDKQGVAQYPPVVKAAFSDLVLNQRVNSRPIQVGPQHDIVVRVKEYQSSQQQSFDDVRDKVEKAARQARATDLAHKAAAAAADALRQGKSLQEVTKGGNAAVKTPGAVKRDSDKVPGPLLQAVFSMPRPQDKKVTVSTVALSDGGVAVVRLAGVDPGNASKAGKDGLAQIQQQIDRQTAAEEFAAYQMWLSRQIKIEVYQKNEPEAGRG